MNKNRVTIFMSFDQIKSLKKAAIDVDLSLSDFLVGCATILFGGIVVNSEVSRKITEHMVKMGVSITKKTK